MSIASFDPRDAAADLLRAERTATAALTPDLRLLCWTWAGAWLVVTALLVAWSAGAPWWVALVGTCVAFAGAGVTTGVHTARRTGLAVDGPSSAAGARAGLATSLALAVGGVAGVWSATHGVPVPDAVRLGLGVAAATVGSVSLTAPPALADGTADGSAGAGSAGAGSTGPWAAGLCWAVALVWWLVPWPAVGAGVLAAVLVVAGRRAGGSR